MTALGVDAEGLTLPPDPGLAPTQARVPADTTREDTIEEAPAITEEAQAIKEEAIADQSP